MTVITKLFRKFAKKQDGNATVEFVILFPGLMYLFFLGFEAGYFMVRNVALERAVDISVREVRLSDGTIPNLEEFKELLCDQAFVHSDCQERVTVAVEPLEKTPGALANASDFACIDTNAASTPAGGNDSVGADGTNSSSGGTFSSDDNNFDTGTENELMVMRVCIMTEPVFPTTGLGLGLKREGDDLMAMVATTAFVNEPGSRSVSISDSDDADSTCGTGNGVGCGTGYGDGNGNNTGVGATNGVGID